MPHDAGVATLTSHFWVTRESLARHALLSPLLPLEALYAAGACLHRGAYALGWRERMKLPLRVISVGNLTVGGSGKTPTAAWLARELHARGHVVALLSRGVGARRARDINVVSDGRRILMSASDAGDEPVWLAQHTPGVPVLSGHNRAALGLRAVSAFGAEIAILDDGLQHHRLVRDVDLLCIDWSAGLGNGHVLPRGPLRESLGALRRVSAVIWTRAPDTGASPALAGSVARRVARLPQFSLRMRPLHLRRLAPATSPEPLDSLRGARVGVLAAIARPAQLCRDLEALGAVIAAVRAPADHHQYTRADVEALDPALRWVTTAKDAVKIPADWVAGRDLVIVDESVEPIAPRSPGPGLVEWLETQVAPGSRD